MPISIESKNNPSLNLKKAAKGTTTVITNKTEKIEEAKVQLDKSSLQTSQRGVTTSRATSGERRKERNTSGQRGNKFNTSCRDISVVVAENNSVVKPKC